MGLLLGIDSGQTLLKAVVYDADGVGLGAASLPCAARTPGPQWAERDAAGLRDQLFEVIVAALGAADADGAAIDAIGVAGHGDGLYFLGRDGAPSRMAILSVDSRGASVLESMRADGSVGTAVAETGQQIFAASMAPLLRWLMAEEPTTLERTRWLLSCKDWLRFCLTGDVATDPADGSSCVATREGTAYSDAALAAYGLSSMAAKLPPILASTAIAGTVLPEVARATGLRAGTPVVVGTHDVVATAVGLGTGVLGEAAVVAGTFGVNLVRSPTRVFGDASQSRPWPEAGHWVVMSGSPTSASNFEWFLRTHMAEVPDAISVANREVADALSEPSELIFQPFLYGGPFGPTSASLLGLQGWHTRGHVLRAIWEGVVFTHGIGLDLLGSRRSTLLLGGGAAKSRVWSQLFADGLDRTVRTQAASEPGTLGAAMLAGVGIGLFPSVTAAQGRCVRVAATYEPDPAARAEWRLARARFNASIPQLGV